ncbi:hypothetical protein SAMN04515674_118107 [Pseudarcicella hirudinis]|uniref:DUF4332 domain-containing protein n=1 Tax=Pseudarcicella hirudinis TaxID=1079859 RepID=A0A1I5YFV6_9BACT|nr:helix-hairpin-helix domain-containing protein [Pseudarcicella hirudinis]SFQ43126.1 hypothetical protein SAMN04515674_118107 [Pseudarcicella hirudinis]
MFQLNPLENPNAWWQHLLMLAVSALLGYIIGYRKSEIEAAENELALLDAKLDDCLKSKIVMKTTVTPQAWVYDDLKKIEGIGEKIETLLHNSGIRTFADLSMTDPDHILEILKSAGPRFQMHNPSTWPKQAELAHTGQWEKLKAWQEVLNKGI